MPETPPIPIEDLSEDIIAKAQRGIGIADDVLAERARITSAALRTIKSGGYDENALLRVAEVLGIHGPSLTQSARRAWKPERNSVDGLECFNTSFPIPGYASMTVNAYLCADMKAGKGIIFDTSANADTLLARIDTLGLTITAIFLTHTHADHIADLDKVKSQIQAPVYVGHREKAAGASPVQEGAAFNAGNLHIAARETPGHSPGGMTWVVTGLQRTVAITGDALFANSIGGIGGGDYNDALMYIDTRILTLPGDTIICPGHGPATTVAEEKAHNPFFPKYKK